MKWVGPTYTVGVAPEKGVYVWGRFCVMVRGLDMCMCREWMVCELD